MVAAAVSVGSESPILAERATQYFRGDTNKLVQDSARTPERFYQDHFARSKKAVAQAFEGLSNTALILGVGAAQDIPLQALAERFDQVVLVDVDVSNTKKAVDRLPDDLQSKFIVEKADLTGVFAELASQAEQIAKEESTYDGFVSKIVDMLPTLKKKHFEYQRMKASFVCSSLVGSQLGGGMISFLDVLTREFYGRAFEPDDRKFDDCMTQIQMDHISELHRLVESDGRVYFADHFSAKGVVHVKSVIEEAEFELGEREFPGVRRIQARVKELFSPIAEDKWGWGMPVKRSVGSASVEEVDGSKTTVPVDVLELREYQISSFNLAPIKV